MKKADLYDIFLQADILNAFTKTYTFWSNNEEKFYMLFNSLHFLIFLPIVVLFYFIIPSGFRYLWLLAASYYFYMCWNAKYALLILFSTFVTYMSGIILEHIKQQGNNRTTEREKKICVAASFVLNLFVLFFFKYFDFALDNLGAILRLAHIQLNRPSFDIILPVGISFYTFQALSYTMDVYRDEIYAEKNFLRYALFVSFFPQLVAGPIERSKNLLKQLAVPTKPDYEKIQDGILLMLWGYFLKVVLADRIAIFVDTVYGDFLTYQGWYLIIATLLFAIQIYCDFSGYSTIAMGASEILGIHLMENFDAPYFSKSVPEFWRRWHISLSSWFKDYLYIPLGGSRKGKWRKYRNIMIIFLVSGLWHGAQWSFVAWGALNGLYQIIGSIIAPVRNTLVKILHLNRQTASHKLLQTVSTFLLIDFTWIFFRANRFKDAFSIMKGMISVHNPWILFDGSLYQCGLKQRDFSLMLIAIVVLLIADFFKYRGIKIREKIRKQDYWFQWIVISGGILFILLTGIWGAGYNAAGFIYFQF